MARHTAKSHKIRKVEILVIQIAIGNSTEAFVEDGFTDGLNIISSDDNNKGKQLPCNL